MAEPAHPEDLPYQVGRTYADYLALGHEHVETPVGRVVRGDDTPRVYIANHLQTLTAETPEEALQALEVLEAELGHLNHRLVVTDPRTSPAVGAVLANAGHSPEATLQMVLPAGHPLSNAPRVGADIRPVTSDGDWVSLGRLMAEDHANRPEATRIDAVTSAQMLATKRGKAPDVQFFIARCDGEDAAYFSSWPGSCGLAMVENLATREVYRRRGLAGALVHQCVADARARAGGEPAVLIGADPDDWPKGYYARLGFRPTCLTWGWLRRTPR